MSDIYNDFLGLIQDFESLPHISKSENIFNITGYPHYENVSSNILSFYLNPNNEHGLGNLFFSSLMILVTGNESSDNNFQVNREVSTLNKGRIDIVIETDNQVIGIENKIFHHLNNDLKDYSDSIDSWARNKDEKKDTVKIILSLKKENESDGFVSITYNEYWKIIKERLGSYISTSSQKWLLYLVDFMASIEQLKGGNVKLDENDIFFIENEERIKVLVTAQNKFNAKLNSMVKVLSEKIEKPEECNRQWIYAKSCLVHDFNFDGNSIAFDLYISAQGWKLYLFGRNVTSQKYLGELVLCSPFSKKSLKEDGSRFEIDKYDLEMDLDEIKESLEKWMRILIEIRVLAK